jgi:hypothetical protein
MQPRTWWTEIVDELAKGAVASPYRRLVVEGLAAYPHSEVFARLARLHRLG